MSGPCGGTGPARSGLCDLGSRLRSAAARSAAAVEALVARAVANHDRAAIGTRWGVGLGREGDLRAAEVQVDSAAIELRRAIGMAIRVPIGMPIRSPDGRQVTQLHPLDPRSGVGYRSNVLGSGDGRGLGL